MVRDPLNETEDGRIMDDRLFDIVLALMDVDIEDSSCGWTQWDADFVGVLGLHVMAGFGLNESQAMQMLKLAERHLPK